MTTYTLIWTKGALLDWRDMQETRRLRAHRISNYPADLASPWLVDDITRLCEGRPWILVGDCREVVARS